MLIVCGFSKNIPAAKSLLAPLTTRESQEKLVTANAGFDIPPFDGMMDFKVWEEVEPPKGTVYNYPPRGDVTSGQFVDDQGSVKPGSSRHDARIRPFPRAAAPACGTDGASGEDCGDPG